MNAPNVRRRPLFVNGMPIVREILDLNAESPRNLQIENPPKVHNCPSLTERESGDSRTVPACVTGQLSAMPMKASIGSLQTLNSVPAAPHATAIPIFSRGFQASIGKQLTLEPFPQSL